MDLSPTRRYRSTAGKTRGLLCPLVVELKGFAPRLSPLLSLARELDEAVAISGQSYGEFRIALERAFRLKLADAMQKTGVERALDRLVLAKGRRITGLDAEELEAVLKRAGTVEVDGKSVPVLSAEQARQIVAQYERLRKEIRDARWNSSSGLHDGT